MYVRRKVRYTDFTLPSAYTENAGVAIVLLTLAALRLLATRSKLQKRRVLGNRRNMKQRMKEINFVKILPTTNLTGWTNALKLQQDDTTLLTIPL